MAEASGETPPAEPPVHHRLSVHGRVGALTLSADLTFNAMWTVLFGASGCGKTTMLRAMAGLTTNLGVAFLRRDPNGPASWATLGSAAGDVAPQRRHLAYAPQGAVLFPHLTVLENISFAGRVRRDGAKVPAFAQEALDLLELGPLAHRLPKQMSGGERQRVGLARALAVPDARLVLLDEPFAGLDRALRDRFLPRLQTLFAQRRTPVISVTHDVDEVFLLKAAVVRLQDGKIVAEGTPQTVLADEAARIRNALS